MDHDFVESEPEKSQHYDFLTNFIDDDVAKSWGDPEDTSDTSSEVTDVLEEIRRKHHHGDRNENCSFCDLGQFLMGGSNTKDK